MSCGPRRDDASARRRSKTSRRTHFASNAEGRNHNHAAEPTIEQETRSEDELDVPWQVVVHNDPVNLMSYVTMVFQRVFGYPREKAERHMLEVHQKGGRFCGAACAERAELYVQQLHGYLLLATLERQC